MKRLTLIRHANADWKDASIADFDRPLNKRGLNEAEALAKLLLERELVPDLLVASAARRAQQTAECVARVMSLDSRRLKKTESLYLAAPDDILALIHDTGPKVAHLAIVGHNPGISDLARRLAPKDLALPELTTGAVCTLTFPARTWNALAARASRAVHYEPPAKLFHSLFT